MNNKNATRCSVLDLPAKEAKQFFLKDTSYCNFELPSYIVFNKIFSNIDKFLERGKNDYWKCNPTECDKVNHIIYSNKDGKYAWRPLQLIHPVLYVSLVNEITNPEHWKTIQECFRKFYKDKKIRCLSVPVKSLSQEQKDKAEQISQWWNEVEQESIAMSLDYDYLIHADIADFYGSIYTHSISWALHTKVESKKRENKNNNKLIGNVIDSHLRQMSYGQTNGIPQGSTLMDFIAEILLGHADCLLYDKLKEQKINDFSILRYRDDYRIFVHNSQEGESVVKALTEVLLDLGLKLNSAKIKATDCVVRDSVKIDKLNWIGRKQTDKNILKHLMLIHEHAFLFPNAGSLIVALLGFHKRIINLRKIDSLRQTIAVTVDVAYHNPKVYAVTAAILSKLISLLPNDEAKIEHFEKIRKRFDKIPNAGYMEIWLQRIQLHLSIKVDYKESICKLVSGNRIDIWNSDWIASEELKSRISSEKIVDNKRVKMLQPVMPINEIELFVRKINEYYGI